MSERREWTLRNDFGALAETAREVRSELAGAGVEEDTVYALDLALEELVGNTIRHGFPEGGEHRIRIELLIGRAEVRLTIEDDAPPFDPTTQPEPPPPTTLAAAPRGGRGILMVRRLIRDMRYQRRRSGNSLALVVPRRSG